MINENTQAMHPADIKAALQKAGSSQTQIANELDVSDTSISLIISGGSSSLRIAQAIAAKIGKPVDDIWPGRYNNDESA